MSFRSFASGGSSRAKPAARASWATTGMERAILVMWRTEIAQPSRRLASDALGQRLGEARLAYPWLSCKQHNAALASLGLPPAPKQQIELLGAADQRRLGATKRSKPAFNTTLADHAPRALLQGEALQLLLSQILHLEQRADQPTRRVGDDHRVRLGEGLQAGCQVRRLADHCLLLRGARAEKIADHDEARRDSNPHLKPRTRNWYW